MENVWVANIISGATTITVLAFFISRLIRGYDDRIKAAEEKAEEIEQNYIKRFEDVHKKIDRTKEEIFHKIDASSRDRSDYRERQAERMGAIETKLDILLKHNNR